MLGELVQVQLTTLVLIKLGAPMPTLEHLLMPGELNQAMRLHNLLPGLPQTMITITKAEAVDGEQRPCL